MDENLAKRAKKRALHLFERMDRTEHELRTKLTQDGYPSEYVDVAVEYVRSFHYLDDYRYACNFVYYKKERLSSGMLKRKLAAKGVDRELIERAIEEEYDQDEALMIRNLLAKRHFAPDCGQEEFARTYQYLMRRGFASAAVLRTMKNFASEPADFKPSGEFAPLFLQ